MIPLFTTKNIRARRAEGGQWCRLCSRPAGLRLPQGAKKRRTRKSIHIQRQQNTRKSNRYPLYKRTDRRYNRNRNALMIQLCMEGGSPYAGGRCANTCLRIALFVPHKFMIPLSRLKSRENRQIPAKYGKWNFQPPRFGAGSIKRGGTPPGSSSFCGFFQFLTSVTVPVSVSRLK